MRKWIGCGLMVAMTLALVWGTGLVSPASPTTAHASAGIQGNTTRLGGNPISTANWTGTYFNNTSVSGSPVVTNAATEINFAWTGSPVSGVNADGFSARWTATINFPTAGWHFRAGADDGVKVIIDNSTVIINEWHGSTTGFATYDVDVPYLTAGDHNLTVEFYDASGDAKVQFSWCPGTGVCNGTTTTGTGTTTGTSPTGAANWTGNYFNNATLSGSAAFTRNDPEIGFNWAANAPGTGVNADNFSVRWTATVNFPTSGIWTFRAGADDGIRMWIDATLIIDQWHAAPGQFAVYESTLTGLTAGNHNLNVEYFELTGNAGAQVLWWAGSGTTTPSGSTTAATAVPTAVPVKPIYAAVTADRLNVRSGPGQGYPVIAQIAYPDNYVVKGAVPDMSWILIDLENGSEGWVTNQWVWLFSADDTMNADNDGDSYPDFVFQIPRVDVEVAPPAPVPAEEWGPVNVFGRTIDYVRVRDGATAYSSQVIGTLPPNAALQIEARNRNSAWYLVSYQGVRGWVSALFVNIYEGRVSDLPMSAEVVPAPPPGTVFNPVSPDTGVPATVRGRANANLVFRNAASVRGEQIGTIPQNTEFVIEGRNRNGAWYLTTFEGQQGWVYSPYVTLIEGDITDLQIR